MENNESSNSINEDQDKLTRKFLKIKNVNVFSNAYNLRLKENDIILGLDGEFFNSSHDDLKKALDENEDDKSSVGEKDIWNIDSIVKKKSGNTKKGVIRFAEDIDDLKN